MPDLSLNLASHTWQMVPIEHMSMSFQNAHAENLMSSEMAGIGPFGESGRGGVFGQRLGHEGRALIKEV